MSDTEFLNADELAEVTGYKYVSHQCAWLKENGWTYVVNAAGRPIVGRWYARLRLSGVKPDAMVGRPSTWQPDFSTLK